MKKRNLLGMVDKRRLKFALSVSHRSSCPSNTKQRNKDENKVVKIIVAHNTTQGEKKRRRGRRKEGERGKKREGSRTGRTIAGERRGEQKRKHSYSTSCCAVQAVSDRPARTERTPQCDWCSRRNPRCNGDSVWLGWSRG
ncbi:hypothetical protein BJY01DRAFT_206475 [Aspergillus pseudoustus]|uniref:Uncharacterized protein n=1 Tax=Aspergillus pseudoustus TaxID=1810923 RepID=A0ABR4KNI0_9EURO